MSKLNVDQKTILELFQAKQADFLIPDYQRPYAWEEAECQTLWNDLFNFAIPNEDIDQFKDNDEYYLGPIVTYKHNDKMEVIDGQQRLTTLMLLLRALYSKFYHMKDKNSIKVKEFIEQCIWKTDSFGNPDKEKLKIDSDVALDDDKEEFLEILRCGDAKDMKSRYAQNYKVFQKNIEDFQAKYSTYFSDFSVRILKNCILLPIEAESQDTALRIFSTLNDRGKPLSDSDIFKAQFYNFFSRNGKKNDFIKEWKNLESLCDKIFVSSSGTPMDELFTRYMYYIRAKRGIKISTTQGLRKFYEDKDYSLLKNEKTFTDLKYLADFWKSVSDQDEYFSEDVLKRLFVLNYAPNSMWTYLVSVYYMQNKDENGKLDNVAFYSFLNKIIAFIWTYAVINPGVASLRTPVYAEMIKVVEGSPVEFNDYKFDLDTVRSKFNVYEFHNMRPITKSMLAWWMYNDDEQELIDTNTQFDIEHIFAKNRENESKDKKIIESLGNKVFLESKINIRASDYRFNDKKKYYLGVANTRKKEATKNKELLDLANSKIDFTEQDITGRYNLLIDKFCDYLKENDLVK